MFQKDFVIQLHQIAIVIWEVSFKDKTLKNLLKYLQSNKWKLKIKYNKNFKVLIILNDLKDSKSFKAPYKY